MKEIKEEYKILKLIQLTGRTMLENGSEISRVESAVVDIGNYYNYSAHVLQHLLVWLFLLQIMMGRSIFSCRKNKRKRYQSR